MSEVTPEPEAKPQLTKVDRQAVDELVLSQQPTLADSLETFYDSNPVLDEFLRHLSRGLSEEKANGFYLGIGAAAVLLHHSQSRTGGTIPEKITEGAIDGAFGSLADNWEKAGAASSMKKLFDMDPELFLAETLLAHKMKAEPSGFIEGG